MLGVSRFIQDQESRSALVDKEPAGYLDLAVSHQQKKKATPGRTPCSLGFRRSRHIERKLKS